MGLKRLLDALARREEQEAIRDARRAMAFARAFNGGVTFEDVLADLVGPQRAHEILIVEPARAESKARQADVE